MSSPTYPLLGDLDDVPDDYVRSVAEAKRLMERWAMDPGFRDDFATDHGKALAQLGLFISSDDACRLVEPKELERVCRALQDRQEVDGDDVVVRYWAFIEEKLALRARLLDESTPAHRDFAAWRSRQIARIRGELGPVLANGNVHAPFAVELTKGCSVGCWFCGVSALAYDGAFTYTEENRQLWAECLEVLKDVMGPAAGHGFLYWATDPLDNPDYERLIADFGAKTGVWPQTTTAQAAKQVDRVRDFLHAARAGGSVIDRFSILSLSQLRVLHASLSPMDMLRVECVPQNRESSSLKNRTGRALMVTGSRALQVTDKSHSSTIACVSGFIINMVDRAVRMVTPCDTSPRWPLGYWVLAEEHFASASDLGAALERMLGEHAQPFVNPGRRLAIRADLTISALGTSLELASPIVRTQVEVGTDARPLADALATGRLTAEEIALRRRQKQGASLASTYAVLGSMHENALFDEEPSLFEFGDLNRSRATPAHRGKPSAEIARERTTHHD